MLGKRGGVGWRRTGEFLLLAFLIFAVGSLLNHYHLILVHIKNRPSMRDSSGSIDYVPTTTSTNKVGSKLGKIRRATGGSDTASTTIAGNHGDKFMGSGGGGDGGDTSRRKSGGGNNQEEEKDDGYDVRAAFEKEHKGKFLGGRVCVVCELYMCLGGYFFSGDYCR